MAFAAAGFLPDRPRPPWFGVALSALFVALIVGAFAGAFRPPREDPKSFEKRTAAPFPELPRTLAAFADYSGRFERFVDDRFGWRAPLVRVDHFAELRDELLRRSEFLARRGIPFLVVIVPEKYSVYPEFLPDWAVPVTAETSLDRIVADFVRHPQLNFIDLREPLRAAKGPERVYYRTDSHWNYLGAMVGYAELMREAMRLVPGLTMAPAPRPPYVAGVDYYSGDLAQMRVDSKRQIPS